MRKYLMLLLACVVYTVCSGKELIAKQIVVDKNGKGDYATVQEAINSVRAFDPAGATVITVKNGIYHEKIVIPDYVCNVKLVGQSADSTIITYNDHAKIDNMGTFRTYTLQIRGNDIQLENLTIENAAEPLAQAVALHTEGDRLSFRNCRFLGNQDTQYLAGEGNRLYFQHCYIEGTTDFIFGAATAVFQHCTIRAKANSYITAASTTPGKKYGFVFLDCRVIADSSVNKLFLGRPWRAHAKTVFIRCELPKAIAPEGWNNWGNAEK